MFPRIVSTPPARTRTSLGRSPFSTKIPRLARALLLPRNSFVFLSSAHTFTSKLSRRLAPLPRVRFRPCPYSASYASRSPVFGSSMATATKIHLSPSTDSGIYSSNATEDGARAASEVLQEDMESHHIFFNEKRFHNHIVHHVLSLYALGASSDEIRTTYNRNKSYQRPAYPVDAEVVKAMHDKAKFQECFYKEKHYSNYLAFFQEEIDAKGVGDVLNEYVFAGDERAESMLSRLFGGLIHPLIHLGFGLEFNQPAVVAQALAQTAVHDDWMGREFFLPVEKMAGGIGKPGKKSLLQLLNEVRADKTLAHSAKWEDANKFRDGVLSRAPQEMLKYAAEYTVSEEQVDERVADMINTIVYYTSTAQRRSKKIKIDFFFIHCVNSSIFFSKIVQLPFLDLRTRLRLLEWQGRLALLMFVSRGSPDLLMDEVTQYSVTNQWPAVFTRSIQHPADDGHLVKLVRALAHGQKVCEPFESRGPEVTPVSGNMWLQIGNMAVDSTVGDGDGSMWIRSTGFDEAWENVPERARL